MADAEEEQFSLCWNNFNTNLSAGFHESLCRGDLVDVTLAAEGQLVKAHRLVLSVCSPYFQKMFTQMPPNQHAFVFLKDVTHSALKDLIQFMYCGEVNVKQDALPTFISAAEALQIKGLTETGDTPAPSSSQSTHHVPVKTQHVIPTSPRPRIQQRPNRPQTAQYRLESEDSSDDKPAVVLHQQPQKRIIQRSITPQTAPKRLKTTSDPLEPTESRQTQQTQSQQQSTQQPQQQTQAQQVITVSASDAKSVGEPEFIDLPMESVPTKAEPVYSDDVGEVEESGDNEATYVEEDSYGDMKYDESYFTENDDKAATSGFTESYTEGDTSATEAQGKIQFIRSQKKNAQLVYNGYIYNKKLTLANGDITWRCSDVSKKRCSAVCVTRNNILTCVRRGHQHPPHWKRYFNRPLYSEEIDETVPKNNEQNKNVIVVQNERQNERNISSTSSNRNNLSLGELNILVEVHDPLH